MWGLQQRKTSNLICQSGESSSSLFPAPASASTPSPVGKGRVVPLIFLHRDIKVNYNLSSRLSSAVASPWLLWVTKVRLLKQYILCDLCKNAGNSSYRQCSFINRSFHNDCEAGSCIIATRLFSFYFEKRITKSMSGKRTHNNCNQGKAGTAPLCRAAALARPPAPKSQGPASPMVQSQQERVQQPADSARGVYGKHISESFC